MSRTANGLALHHRALEVCAEAAKLLAPFEEREWATLSREEKIVAGILGKWCCERLILAFAAAAGRHPRGESNLSDLIQFSCLPLSDLYRQSLEKVSAEISSEPSDEDIWEYRYEEALRIAMGLRECVIQNLFLLL